MALSDVTYEELADLVKVEIEGGNESERQEGRRRLLEVIEALDSEQTDGEDRELLENRTWRLAEVSIEGVGGVGSLEPSSLSFTPTPSLTVLRGGNGQGKTSIARGIDCGLRGATDVSADASGTLWDAALLTEGVDGGSVELTLTSGSARLDVAAQFSETTTEVRATLTEGGESRPISLRDPWRRALTAGRAYYSYGALQNRIVESTSLQGYLEELLVLGPRWELVRTAVDARAAEAMAARRASDAAVRTARTREEDLTRTYMDDPRCPKSPGGVAWPKIARGLDLDRWLSETGLTAESDSRPVRVSAEHESSVAAFDEELRVADRALAEAESGLESPEIAGALHHIEQVLRIEELDSAHCPLCGTTTAWRDHAEALLTSLRGRNETSERVTAVIARLWSWVDAELRPLAASDPDGGPMEIVEAFLDTAAQGCHAHSAAHAAARQLLEVLGGHEYWEWLDRQRATADAGAEWRSALAGAVHQFVADIRDHVDGAADAGAWKKAQDTLNQLQVTARQGRQDSETERLRVSLDRLLPDAAVELADIRHPNSAKQRGGVQIDMTIGGRSATLGMLSSGQRNALLLAPLLGLDVLGAIGFIVIDDPVHALDDLRVDLLAQELARLAKERQVIVLTHDPRLEEHLRARHRNVEIVELDREPVTRTVRVTRMASPWKRLLDDASDALSGADSDSWRFSEPVRSVVGGLCRDAVDGAIRQAIITYAVTRCVDEAEALADLDRAETTAKRIAHVTCLAGGKPVFPVLESSRSGHLKTWNQGSHGQVTDDADLPGAIAAAERACMELVDHDWAVT